MTVVVLVVMAMTCDVGDGDDQVFDICDGGEDRALGNILQWY